MKICKDITICYSNHYYNTATYEVITKEDCSNMLITVAHDNDLGDQSLVMWQDCMSTGESEPIDIYHMETVLERLKAELAEHKEQGKESSYLVDSIDDMSLLINTYHYIVRNFIAGYIAPRGMNEEAADKVRKFLNKEITYEEVGFIR